MEFSIQLSAYYPDKSYGGDRVYGDMLNGEFHGDFPASAKTLARSMGQNFKLGN